MEINILNMLYKYTEINSPDSLEKSMKIADIGLKSLQFVQFIVEIEEELAIEIQDDDLLVSNFQTVGDICETIEKYLRNKQSYKKVLVCDCDNCLWNGIAGEEEIWLNDSCINFQKKVVELYNKGVLICLCSKNMPENIEAAFSKLSMSLKKEHIVIEKINYYEKYDNLLDISRELNVGLDSLVFVDDSVYEIGLVKEIIPEVMTIQINHLDQNGFTVSQLDNCFNMLSFTNNRTQLYREQKEREKKKSIFSTINEYNEFLETEVVCKIAVDDEIPRISELSLRTNQFNMSAKRYSVEELAKMAESDLYDIYSLSAKDRYGDMGIVAAAVVNKKLLVIEAFFISCRVFGRGFEMELLQYIKLNNGSNMSGIYIQTEKNKRFSSFYKENGISDYLEARL